MLELKKCEKKDFSQKRKTFIEVFSASLKMENAGVSIFLHFFGSQIFETNLIFKVSSLKES